MTAVVGLTDVAPTRFERFAVDDYFTNDAHWIVRALLHSTAIVSPILEFAAGLGHIVVELGRSGFTVVASDLYAHPNPLIDDIATGVDIFDLDSLVAYRWVVTNLPYREQGEILRHILAIAARDGCSVAILARSEWRSAGDSRALIHANSHFAREIALKSGPSGFVRRLRAPATGSRSSSGRAARTRPTRQSSASSNAQAPMAFTTRSTV
jgi:hypothetical protein